MILDAYIPTRTTSALEVRVITDSPRGLTIKADSREIVLAQPGLTYRGEYFFRQQITGLFPGQPVSIKISQAGQSGTRELRVRTQPAANGRHLLRFGIHADPHLGPAGGRLGGKRLYAQSEELCRKYLRETAAAGAAFILLLGDVVDPATPENLALMQDICAGAGVPCYPLIGNHEGWGGSESDFYRAAGLPPEGYTAFTVADTLFLCLSTPHQGALDRGTDQWEWLCQQLAGSRAGHVLLFSHFSFLLHPCVQGAKNDGMQVMDNHREILRLIAEDGRVRACFAGHKNVPSRVMRDGVAHLLSPQLIQAPCSYLLIDLYEDGLRQTIFEIEEQHFLQVSRKACGSLWPERYGTEAGRNYFLPWQ